MCPGQPQSGVRTALTGDSLFTAAHVMMDDSEPKSRSSTPVFTPSWGPVPLPLNGELMAMAGPSPLCSLQYSHPQPSCWHIRGIKDVA